MASASLRRSDHTFRRQGSSGIVWGAGSNPAEIDSKPISSSMEKSEALQPPITLFHSRSTGSIQTPMAMFHAHRSGDSNINVSQASHKSKFRFGRWIKRVLLKFH